MRVWACMDVLDGFGWRQFRFEANFLGKFFLLFLVRRVTRSAVGSGLIVGVR